MTSWMNKINLKDLRENYVIGVTSSALVGKEVARRFKKLLENLKGADEYNREELESIIDEFESIVTTASLEEQEEEFNAILEALYDWGDTPLETPIGEMQRKLCWIGFALY